MEQCVFCDIVAGKAPASKVYEDATICAFLTIGPVTPGHLLVIPNAFPLEVIGNVVQ
jgi:histidine triad (HIT) family protein